MVFAAQVRVFLSKLICIGLAILDSYNPGSITRTDALDGYLAMKVVTSSGVIRRRQDPAMIGQGEIGQQHTSGSTRYLPASGLAALFYSRCVRPVCVFQIE